MKSTTFLLCLVAILLSSCSVKMAQTWTDPAFDTSKEFNKIAVFGIRMKKSTSNTFEREFSAYLISKGVDAIQGSSLFQSNSINWNDPDTEMIRRVLKDNGVDGVVISSVVDQQTHLTHRQETSDYYTAENYYWFSRYYTDRSINNSKQGYYDAYDTYLLENHFYEVEDSNGDGKGLVWVGESEIIDPASVQAASKDFSKTLFNSLKKAKILP